MKRICAALALLVAAASAGAQTMYDAINFSQVNYSGTARSMALGNAMTAVGGDLGAIAINPAGSSVLNYNVFSFTPSITVSAVSSQYSPVGVESFSPSSIDNDSRFTMPNIGLVTHINTGRSSGIKRWSFSFISNQSNNYQSYCSSSGYNDRTSMAGAMAYKSFGAPEDLLRARSSFNDSNLAWDILCAYQSRMTGSVADGWYIGNNEVLLQDGDDYYNYLPGQLSQTSVTKKYGARNDIILNTAVDVDDWLHIGFTLGLPMVRYRYIESFTESAVISDQFPVDFNQTSDQIYRTYFKSNYSDYTYSANADGVFGKFGIIALPTRNIRVGLSFQTPSALVISEAWQNTASSHFSDKGFDARSESPVGEYLYCLRSPYTFNAGIAYTFGTKGFLSVDYEMMDYSIMKFSDRNYSYLGSINEYFVKLNSACRHFSGLSHSLRAGLEFRLNPVISLRAGYNLITSPERFRTDKNGSLVTADIYLDNFESFYDGTNTLSSTSKYNEDTISSFSFGIGYSSPGSFFADFAIRKTSYPLTRYSLYNDYDGVDADGKYQVFQAPTVKAVRNLWNASITLGWRF